MYQFKNQLVAWSKCDNDCNFYKLLSEESACCQKTEMENANSDIRDQPPRFMWAFVVYPCRPRKGTDFTQNEATRMSNIGYQETGLWNRTPRFLMTCRQLLLDQQHEVISSIHRRYVGQYLANVLLLPLFLVTSCNLGEKLVGVEIKWSSIDCALASDQDTSGEALGRELPPIFFIILRPALDSCPCSLSDLAINVIWRQPSRRS